MLGYVIVLLLICTFSADKLCFAASYGHVGGYKYGLNVHHAMQKRQVQQSFITTGIPSTNGRLPFRREIRDLQHNYAEIWELYILALDLMQYTDQTDPFSWYQIAGIHAAPFQSWGNVPLLPGSDPGYCMHESTLFCTWHRPYLALYEQVLYNLAQFIATLYTDDTDRTRYQDAAQNFRIPYWDFAALPQDGSSVFPLSIGGFPDLNVSGPNGWQLIDNPLYSFAFKPFNGSMFPDAPFNMWNETKRAPRPISSPEAMSNNSYVATTLDANMPSYQQRLYNLFANYRNYTTFSNEAWIPYGTTNNATFDSIESLHDTVHIATGGTFGHMAIIAYSAFDPVFFNLHANVDRLFAMWQVLYPDSYVEPAQALIPTSTVPIGEIVDSMTPLKPFYSNSTAFWSSEAVRDHTVFGYTYEEVANRSRVDVIKAINAKYSTYSPPTMDPNQPSMNQSAGRTQLQKMRLVGRDVATKVAQHREWVVNIRVNRHALASSFSIYFFLGPIPEDPMSWPTAITSAGSLGIWANIGTNGSMSRHIVSGTVPLTRALLGAMARDSLRSLSPTHVYNFLQEGLQVRVALVDGTPVDASSVDGLAISIASAPVELPNNDQELAKWGESVSHIDLF